MGVNSCTAVLLQTALAFVGQLGDSEHRMKARIVFDSCSERTCVLQHLREIPNLRLVGEDTLKITAFENDEPSQKEYEQVQRTLQRAVHKICDAQGGEGVLAKLSQNCSAG